MDLSVATSGSHSGALASARSGEARRHSAQFVRDRRLHCRTSWGSLMKPFLIVAVCAATGFGWTPRCASQGQPRSLFNGKDLTGRSEEHTSELQSQSNLVCRLLLE